MNIGAAARASGISAKMLRYYENIGLIQPAGRSAAGYRQYSSADIHTLRFIRRARDMGFSIKKTGELLALWQDQSRHSEDVKRLATEHIDVLNHTITELQAMVSSLQSLLQGCAGDDRPDCPILEEIANPQPQK
ncbi:MULTISPECIES: Cu(I)-responsive transcriptional regulator [unclassified Oceanobacter]|uniref:Cu(I)-responsive transcriptional regulator n=1 Tax=unclassified Oceanobacter TaxID=2620260 RepID=UPI0026E437AB|nr:MULTISPECIES: Cu(I)-responsive transcriptional regulator [unclassified Oceanobacter]MDO6682085.1 Cu(I)-responsive transcriptional regulator [Oceanobacter sp. 5_MG-2023]MDP2505520.1 Cu(I)-responsive transcriptional regulator [Oceanobacter sp. 3_MG-2023]MDP2547095.1 Cu(I)-responsive transcriptional regulator [Oceanobacter sp. 4_MG-2023]MDP2609720.1 Cu(I)-responsive transcriptional regulator [Oceanobacter sp. 1_MG-2023]MDP2613051.1 Cu(I)-responsive transcriptional regulator [Oceanobacter sp. 2